MGIVRTRRPILIATLVALGPGLVALVGAGPAVAAPTATTADTGASCTATGSTVTCRRVFSATGAEQSFTVPTGVTGVTVTAVGAPGGSPASFRGGTPGGRGGVATGGVPVAAGDVLYVEVGDTNGFNGGGVEIENGAGGAGGGASDVRTVPMSDAAGTLASRVVVAGGGGGGGAWGDGPSHPGGTGGDAGQPGAAGRDTHLEPGGGGGGAGTATAGGGGTGGGTSGSLGQGGTNGTDNDGENTNNGGSGGGGLYGGGGGGGTRIDEDFDFSGSGGGGGGSSLAGPGGTTRLAPVGAPASVTLAWQVPVVGVEVSPGSSTSLAGRTVALTAYEDLADGSLLDVTARSQATLLPAGGACPALRCTPSAVGRYQVRVTTPAGVTSASLTVRPSSPSTTVPRLTGVRPSSGPVAGGTTVVLVGAGFGGATDVSFDGVAAAFVVQSDGRILATSPAHAAGAVRVAVSTAAGTSNPTRATVFTYSA